MAGRGGENSGVKVGLALSGGGVRGLAHLGIMASLVEAGIPIHCISGASVGAVVGALYAAGVDLDTLLELAPRVRWTDLVVPIWPAQGLLSLKKMEHWLVMMTGRETFEELALPLGVVATETATGRRVLFDSGPLAPAVHASCAIPFVFEPVTIDGAAYFDGGVSDNLPVAAARWLGADYVIGCDVFEPNYARRLGPLGRALAALETLVRQAGGGVREADFLIQPHLADRGYGRLPECLSIIERGRAAARAVLPALIADLEARAGGQGHQPGPAGLRSG
jgi:NTE family protein